MSVRCSCGCGCGCTGVRRWSCFCCFHCFLFLLYLHVRAWSAVPFFFSFLFFSFLFFSFLFVSFRFFSFLFFSFLFFSFLFGVFLFFSYGSYFLMSCSCSLIRYPPLFLEFASTMPCSHLYSALPPNKFLHVFCSGLPPAFYTFFFLYVFRKDDADWSVEHVNPR